MGRCSRGLGSYLVLKQEKGNDEQESKVRKGMKNRTLKGQVTSQALLFQASRHLTAFSSESLSILLTLLRTATGEWRTLMVPLEKSRWRLQAMEAWRIFLDTWLMVKGIPEYSMMRTRISKGRESRVVLVADTIVGRTILLTKKSRGQWRTTTRKRGFQSEKAREGLAQVVDFMAF